MSDSTGSSLSGLAVADCLGMTAALIRWLVSEVTWSVYSKVWEEWFSLVNGMGSAVVDGDDRLLVLYFIGQNVEAGVSVFNRRLVNLGVIACMFVLICCRLLGILVRLWLL